MFTLYYEKQCGPATYDEEYNEEYYDTETIEYEVDDDDLITAIAHIIADDTKSYTQTKDKEVKEVILSAITETLSTLYGNDEIDLSSMFDGYKEELEDYFRDKAMED